MSFLRDGKQSLGILGLISFLQIPVSSASLDRSLVRVEAEEDRMSTFADKKNIGIGGVLEVRV